jgi:preprotein translocase subunit SecD
MVVYYRLPGLIADLALVIYTILTLAAFNLLGVTLTLPGIAGFILSIGMAVDANVLIFERTREELRSGKTLYRSVESGFYRAFSSILDSNVTTLIACGALFWLGAGLVKGFALTLALGVLVSMFTAITCSRTLLLYALSFQGLRKPQYFCPNLQPVKAEA